MILRKLNLASMVAIAILGMAGPILAQAGADDPRKVGDQSLPVRYYSQQDVDASFNQKGGGDMLYDGEEGSVTRPFKIATSIRSKPGGGEIHMKLTDVVYILKGTATVVTGGQLSDIIEGLKYPGGKPFPKDEIRGHSVVGGKAQHLAPGDAIIIPNGVPHQFTEVQGPFLYYVVKVRQP
jgi:mannose-6-phosphate isomerase-like protein (cupin superfamily)